MAKQSPSDEEFKLLLTALKRVLKEKGYSYEKLAADLGLSVSGVKKALNSNDLSFKRVIQICQLLGISVRDLLTEQSSAAFDTVEFSSEHQELFLKHPDLWKVFWKLSFERLPVLDAQYRLGLTEAEMFRHLRKLDEMGLIELHAENKVRLPKLRTIRHFGDGPLMRKLYRDWSRELIDEVGLPHPPPDARFVFRYFKVKPETYEDLLASIDELEREFVKRAVREMSFYSEGLVDVRWIIGARTGSFVKDTKPRKK